MNNFFRKAGLFVMTAASVTMAFASAGTPALAQDKVVVNWFVGLGTGTNADQKQPQQDVVDAFNKSQDKITLKINIAATNQQAPDILATLIASGNAPDIVGPVGFTGSNAFINQWADLTQEVAKTKYNLAQFPDALLKIYADPAKGMTGIPFAVYPGVMYYNKDMFDEAGLAYPPAKNGDKYKMPDGTMVDWSYDTVANIAKILTVDANGNDATNAKFDPTKIKQWGFVQQYGGARRNMSNFGGQPVVDAKGKVVISDAWRAEAQWEWDGLWKYHFIPNATDSASTALQPSEFASGKVGMAVAPIWYTCCMAASKAKWDIAVQPSYKGTTYAPADADTFRLSKDSKNLDAAFTVLQYLLGDGAGTLLHAYGAFPARADLAAATLKTDATAFPTVTHWDIVSPQLAYAVSPHHESYFPNFSKGQDRFAQAWTLLYGDTGKTIDINKELDKLQSDLQAIVDSAGAPAAAATMAATAAK